MWSAAAMPPLSERRHGRRTPRLHRLVVIAVAVRVVARLLDLVGDQRHGDAELDPPAQRLGEAEADEEADDGAAGDELRRVFAGKGLEVELLAETAIELVDVLAHAVAGPLDGPPDGRLPPVGVWRSVSLLA